MIVNATIVDDQRCVTVPLGGRPGLRFTPDEARAFGHALIAGADAADKLELAPNLRRLGFHIAEWAQIARGSVFRLWYEPMWFGRAELQSRPHATTECQVFSYTRTPCTRCR